jgi:hypothetical protein
MRNSPQAWTIECDCIGADAAKCASKEYGVPVETVCVVGGPKCGKAVNADSLKRDISVAMPNGFGDMQTMNAAPFLGAVCAGTLTDNKEFYKTLESYWKRASKLQDRG